MTRRTLPDGAVVVAAGDVLASDFGSEMVILNLGDGVYYGLEDVGIRIWHLVRKPTTVAVVCATLLQEYDIDLASCERDVRELLGSLAERGLVEIRESG